MLFTSASSTNCHRTQPFASDVFTFDVVDRSMCQIETFFFSSLRKSVFRSRNCGQNGSNRLKFHPKLVSASAPACPRSGLTGVCEERCDLWVFAKGQKCYVKSGKVKEKKNTKFHEEAIRTVARSAEAGENRREGRGLPLLLDRGIHLRCLSSFYSGHGLTKRKQSDSVATPEEDVEKWKRVGPKT